MNVTTQAVSPAPRSKRSPAPAGTKTIPRFEGGLPVLGHTAAFHRNPVAFLEEGYRAHGEVFRFLLAGKDFVVLAGPRAHEAYFRAAEDHLSAKDVYQFTIPIFGKGVAYDAPRDIMNEQLGFLFPALREKRMQTYARLMHEEASAYVSTWGDEGEVDLPHVTNDITVNIAARCLLGQEIRESFYDGFADLYEDLQLGINTIGFFAHWLPTPRHIKRDRARKKVSELISGILRERRRSGVERDDFMQTLMAARYKSGRALTDDEITGILLTTLFGGQHTSSVLAAWVGIELLQHPQYLPPILDEIDHFYGKGFGARTSEAMTTDTLRGQVTLERAIKECERLHPPLIMLIRKVMREFEYDGFVVNEGSMAMVAPALSHRLRSVFRDPHRYDPDRFAPPREEDKQTTYTLIGFGGGKHRCIGMAFAYMQLKAIWTVLLSNFEFELASAVPAPDYSGWVIGPQQPCKVRFKRRKA